MGNIAEYLRTLRTAVFGKDVRESIAQSIEQTYEDATRSGNANMEVSDARGYYSSLKNRLDGDKNDLQTQINGLASGSPLVASSVSEMTDTSRVYVNTTDGHWYTYNGSSWIDGGAYQAAEDSETVERLVGEKVDKDIEYSYNLNSGNWVNGYINADANGNLVLIASDYYLTSDYIPLNKKSICFWFRKMQRAVNLKRYVLLDEDKKILGSIVLTTDGGVNSNINKFFTITVPNEYIESAKYIKVSINSSSQRFYKDDFIISYGTQPNYEEKLDYQTKETIDNQLKNIVKENELAINESAEIINYTKQKAVCPIKNYYNEPYRPQYHISPEIGFMNDPCGFVYFNNMYHLYYQLNPYTKYRNAQCWGHVVSKDLVHWESLPVAIPKTREYDIWSGNCIVDNDNLAGFGKNVLLAYVTERLANNSQRQALYYSIDGNTFKRYGIIIDSSASPTPDNDNFRDPKVIWLEKYNYYLMVTCCYRCFGFYTSTNLKNWTYVGSYNYSSQMTSKSICECPNIAYFQEEDVLVLFSTFGDGKTVYWVGDWNGSTFAPFPGNATKKYLDAGFEFYAMNVLTNAPDGNNYAIGWANTHLTGDAFPTGNSSGVMSLVRKFTLENTSTSSNTSMKVCSKPLEIYEEIFAKKYEFEATIPRREIIKIPIALKRGRVRVTFDFNGFTTPSKYNELRLFCSKSDYYLLQYQYDNNDIIHNRTYCGNNNFYGTKKLQGIGTNSIERIDNKIVLDVFIDGCISECYINNGKMCITDAVFPRGNEIQIFTSGGDVKAKIEIYDYTYTLSEANKLSTNLGEFKKTEDSKLTADGITCFSQNHEETEVFFNERLKSTIFKLDCDIQLQSYFTETMSAKVYFGYQSSENHYYAKISADNTISLHKVENNVDITLGSSNFETNLFTLYKLSINVLETSISLSVDDNEIINIEDTGIQEGLIGICSNGYGATIFQNIYIEY